MNADLGGCGSIHSTSLQWSEDLNCELTNGSPKWMRIYADPDPQHLQWSENPNCDLTNGRPKWKRIYADPDPHHCNEVRIWTVSSPMAAQNKCGFMRIRIHNICNEVRIWTVSSPQPKINADLWIRINNTTQSKDLNWAHQWRQWRGVPPPPSPSWGGSGEIRTPGRRCRSSARPYLKRKNR